MKFVVILSLTINTMRIGFLTQLSLWMGLCFAGYAQKMDQVSNFRENQLIYNPAAAGIGETEFSAGLMTRLQWASIDHGAPNYQYLWADYKMNDTKSSVGLNVNRISFGVTRIMELAGNYTYLLHISSKVKLGMGLRVGSQFIRINDLPANKIWDSDDPFQYATQPNYSIPHVGTGFRLSLPKAYIGLAAPDLMALDRNNVYGNKNLSFLAKRRNYMLTGGYKVKLSEVYRMNVNALVLYFPGNTVRANVNANFEIRDYFWAGLTYATNHFHTLMVGTHISSALRASYAFQVGLGSKIPGGFTTHEICLMLDLDTRKK